MAPLVAERIDHARHTGQFRIQAGRIRHYRVLADGSVEMCFRAKGNSAARVTAWLLVCLPQRSSGLAFGKVMKSRSKSLIHVVSTWHATRAVTRYGCTSCTRLDAAVGIEGRLTVRNPFGQ
jgi:hypothetical protein